jgi:hypothetical protein
MDPSGLISFKDFLAEFSLPFAGPPGVVALQRYREERLREMYEQYKLAVGQLVVPKAPKGVELFYERLIYPSSFASQHKVTVWGVSTPRGALSTWVTLTDGLLLSGNLDKYGILPLSRTERALGALTGSTGLAISGPPGTYEVKVRLSGELVTSSKSSASLTVVDPQKRGNDFDWGQVVEEFTPPAKVSPWKTPVRQYTLTVRLDKGQVHPKSIFIVEPNLKGVGPVNAKIYVRIISVEKK